MMGLTPAVCTSFLLAVLLISATLDCAGKQDKHLRENKRGKQTTVGQRLKLFAATPVVATNCTVQCSMYSCILWCYASTAL